MNPTNSGDILVEAKSLIEIILVIMIDRHKIRQMEGGVTGQMGGVDQICHQGQVGIRGGIQGGTRAIIQVITVVGSIEVEIPHIIQITTP